MRKIIARKVNYVLLKASQLQAMLRNKLNKMCIKFHFVIKHMHTTTRSITTTITMTCAGNLNLLYCNIISSEWVETTSESAIHPLIFVCIIRHCHQLNGHVPLSRLSSADCIKLTSCATSCGKSKPNEDRPISAQAFFFMRTYVAESFRSPTRTTARPGTCPPLSCENAATFSFSSARISAAVALPVTVRPCRWSPDEKYVADKRGYSQQKV